MNQVTLKELQEIPLSLAFISYFLQATFFLFFINPFVMDPDSHLGLSQFQHLLPSLVKYICIKDTTKFLQFIMLFFSTILLIFLYVMGLIKKHTLKLYLLIPFSAYLAVKIKLEFFIAILSIIKMELKIKHQIFLILLLFLVFLITKENNLIILISFRIIYLLMNLANSFFIFIKIIITAIIVDKTFDILANTPLGIILLSRFYWTRNIVNPEYSIIESIGVFVSSFHLSINAVVDWKFHLLFSGPLFLYISYKFLKKYKNLDKKLLYSFIACYFVFTHITHAFQNARYYYFYIHLLAELITKEKELMILLILGWFHVLFIILINHIIFFS